MNDFLRSKSLDEDYGYTWVVVPENGSDEIIAFYTIEPDPIAGITDNEYGEYPVVFITLAVLGVDVKYQERGIGTRLLMRIIRQILLVASQHSINGLFLTALNQNAKAWYLRREIGFQEATPGSMHLLLPVASMRLLPGMRDLCLPHEGF